MNGERTDSGPVRRLPAPTGAPSDGPRRRLAGNISTASPVVDDMQRRTPRIAEEIEDEFGNVTRYRRHPNGRGLVATTATVDPTAFLAASVYVEPGAQVGRSATIATGSWVDREAVVGPGARLGAAVHVGPQAVIGAGAQVGSHCKIGSGARIASRARISPDQQVPSGAVVGAGAGEVSSAA